MDLTGMKLIAIWVSEEYHDSVVSTLSNICYDLPDCEWKFDLETFA